jgi:gas vesicle protein
VSEETNNNHNINSKDFIIGALVGGIVGAASAFLFAPKSGKELRSNLNDHASSFREKTEHLAAAAKERGEDIAETAKTVSSEISEAVLDQTGELKEKVQETTSEMQDKVQEKVQELKSGDEEERLAEKEEHGQHLQTDEDIHQNQEKLKQTTT